MSVRRHRSTRERVRLFALHAGRCHFCGGAIDGVREAWEISHEIPLELGGADDDQNAKPAHRRCHRIWTAQVDLPMIAKAKRRAARHQGAEARSRRPLPGSRASRVKLTLHAGPVDRLTGEPWFPPRT